MSNGNVIGSPQWLKENTVRFEIAEFAKRFSKWELSQALLEGKELTAKLVVSSSDNDQNLRLRNELQWRTNQTFSAKLIVNFVQAEDGSRESWNIQGYARVGDTPIEGAFKGYVRTDRKPGVNMGVLQFGRKWWPAMP